MKNLKEIRKLIIANKLDYINVIIAQIWNKNPEDYNISYYKNDFFELDDFTVRFDKFELIEDENISENIFNEFYDGFSGGFYSERYKNYIYYRCSEEKDTPNLKEFFLYCKKNTGK